MASSPLAPHSSSAIDLKERVEAERRGHPFLLYRDGGGNQCVIVLEAEDRLTVGRRPSNTIGLGWDVNVSRVHAQLERIGDAWTVADDGLSRNGSWVNADRVTGRRRLIDGDVMRFGDTLIAYVDPKRGESRVTEEDASPVAANVTEAQRRVLLALCRPYKDGGEYATPPSNKQIADELFIGIDAVKTHMRALFYAFGVGHLPQNQKRARLVERALRTGFVLKREL
jgi:pSer/pThr/pTyr-binding forkhead associated (FHA) protein